MKQSTKIIIDKSLLSKKKYYHFIKRVFDFCASLLGIIILSPLFLVIALLIKLEDRGPVFYKQKRVGKDQREFNMFKFRSMHVDADKRLAELKKQNEVEGPMFKMKNDPRVTRIGHFIRKTSIDELPQLFNVLRGEMSLVGPRPPLPSEVKEYTDYDMQRLLVVPGCSGLWQATVRNSVGFHEMVQLDLEYIQKSSIWFDIKILFMTIKILFKPNSAY
ncbi:sugar transferase [Ligilactobacillus apodemi]|uniref:Undecaprenyl-phosphate beta-glucosephosphotransferase n=1 Tax=Ligilactobacillus apodemi DSM 16634 = JCM 16172 TaxID=1423724 RepID=A0A0R1U8E7_9LACO|nr:sugar transferase [Ligilactobacillus apodemi]KRL87464.1 undecaprenyl-phosphate beta-glucosephosphotransferase [Ligilactobacillus apodemi DSM 16634 = JCM 16172]MCR1901938.1 sugar transferase [Ligilactobacillus apodemi]